MQKNEVVRGCTMKKKTGSVIRAVGMFLCPVAMYYLMEAFHMNAFIMTRWRAQLLNIVFFELLMLVLFLVTGRLRIALIAETVLVLAAGLANYYVLSFRSNPIVPWDIFSIRTAASVAGEYDYALGARQVLTLLGFAALLVAEFFFMRIVIDKKKVYKRIAGAAGVACLLVGFTRMLWSDAMVNRFHLYPFLFTPAYMSQADGFAVTFLMDLKYLTVDKPEGYDAADAKETLKSYETEEKDAEEGELPNVIVIMDEAFSDPAVLGDMQTNEDYMPFIHSLQQGADHTVTGYLNVSVKGGNTANTSPLPCSSGSSSRCTSA